MQDSAESWIKSASFPLAIKITVIPSEVSERSE